MVARKVRPGHSHSKQYTSRDWLLGFVYKVLVLFGALYVDSNRARDQRHMRAILEENQAEKERSRYNLCPISFNFVKKVRDL